MTRHHITTSLLMGVVLLIGFVGTASAEIPQVISYQGKVMDTSGNPVADGNYTMRFRIYDAVTVGTLKWDSGVQTVAVAGGVFSVLLGESPQPALGLDFSQDYWLAVTFSGVDQTPRQRMASSGYAYMASGLVAGTQVSGAVTSGTSAAIKAVNTAPTGNAYGIYGESTSSEGTGVYGYADATTGDTNGVYGLCSSNDGIGVYGLANATMGTTYGVFGSVASTNGRGVCGEATATSGGTRAVYGRSYSSAGTGVYGYASATSGDTYGVYGRSDSPAGFGGHFVGRGYFSGWVGIGTTSPDCALEINGDGSSWASGFLKIENGDADAGIRLYDSEAINAVKHHLFNDNAAGDRLRIAPEGNYASGITVLQNGNVGVNTTNPLAKFAVGDIAASSGHPSVIVNTSNGCFYYSSSSRRYKEEIKPLAIEFERILHAEPKSFIDKETGQQCIGYIAEEFDTLGLRELVFYRDGQPDGLKYDLVALYLLEIIKDLKAENEAIRADIAALNDMRRD